MSDDTIKYIWKCVAIFFCVAVVSQATYCTLTTGKNNNAQQQLEMRECMDGGGSYIGSNCIKIRCWN